MCVGSTHKCRVTDEIVVPFCLHYCRGCAGCASGRREENASITHADRNSV